MLRGEEVYIVIVGGGAVCEAFVERALKEYRGVKITVIDKNGSVCERISRKYHMVHVISGDATDPHILEEAGVADADVFLAVTGDDKTNIMSALLARRLNVKNIIVRINNPIYEELAKILGLLNIIRPAKSAAIQIDILIRNPGLVDLLELARRDVEMYEIKVDEGSPYAHRKVEETDLFKDHNVSPVLIFRGDDVLLPKPNVKVKPGDKILVVKKKGGLLSHILS